jgi:hypothetical protein
MSSKIVPTDQTSPKAKVKYQVLNWPEYNRAFENRGNITLLFSEQVIEDWYSQAAPQQGAQQKYRETCIEAIMLFKTVFRLAYRQVRGFTVGLLSLLRLDDPDVPSHTQINRRFRALDIAPFAIPKSGPITIAIDSTGVKVYGEGEWKCRKHGWSKRRTWRQLHLGVDPGTNFIHCHTTTTNAESDVSQVDDLLDQVEDQIEEVYLDGAYDSAACIDGLLARNIHPVIPPQRGAVEWYLVEVGDLEDYPRNQAIRRIDEVGRKEWKKEARYHRRSLSETAMYRYKTIFGPQHYSRSLSTQTQGNKMKIKALNQMTAYGMPDSKPKVA